ncbi:MAG: bifunctional uridylyltransferase/uridylyl-removing protein, partial [Alphaproteobacteria bacterium]|nr:bifunctional uridylyltransferase/uridylyl-removing protein [Alphaproteobacteria bacterium]
IINRRVLEQNIAALSPDMAAGERRALLLSWLKSAYQAGSAEIRRRFEQANAENDLPDYGQMAARSTAYLTDQILRIMYDEASLRLYPAANPTAQDHMSLIAVGGYGRFEMAPYSDIDLLFLVPWKPTPHCEQIIEHMIYMLWDMGLKLGHAVRGIDHCLNLARSDSSIRAAILDARYVWGEPQIFADFRRQFDLILQADGAEFAREKWGERQRRHEKMDDSRYVLEPNIKEGIGGLRDVQTLIWVARFAWRIESATDLVDRNILTHSEARQFEKSYEFLWKLRFHLHYLAGRAEERIIFDLQPELARRLHYTDRQSGKGVERFMKFYFLVARWVGELGRIIEA